MKIEYFLILIFSLLFKYLSGQENSITNPIFSPFKGVVYDMPELERWTGKAKVYKLQEFYSDTIYSYEIINDISLDKINIPNADIIESSFPGVDKQTKFAMILNSIMVIKENGCYEFSLNSDDGSILWINDQEIINNDGGHKMQLKKDTVYLEKGNYDIKLWYFQGLPYNFGFIFNGEFLSDFKNCTTLVSIDENKDAINTNSKKIILKSLFFDSDKDVLNGAGLEELKRIAILLQAEEISQIQIIGHTDLTGKEDYNKDLSNQRAKNVMLVLKKLLDDQGINFSFSGKASTEPIADNKTIEGRQKNRRVEIIYHSR